MVIERFPSRLPWRPPSSSHQYVRGGGDTGEGGYPLLTRGLIQCAHCHSNRTYKLNWPDDAYWQWQIRGELLWAWDRDHARIILDYVSAQVRPSRRSSELKYIPSHFLTAKVRGLVVTKMAASLDAG